MIVDSTAKRGYDAWVDSANTHATHGSASWMQLQTATKRGYLWLPISPLVHGRTIASATLTGHVHGVLDAQTITVAPAASGWQASTITWSNQPTTRSGTATAVNGSPQVDGSAVVFDMTALVQQVATGGFSHFGWRVSTNAAAVQKLATFDAGVLSWTLEYEYDEPPDAPSALAPNGTVAGAAKPVVTFDFTEYGATQSDLAMVRVETDNDQNGSVDWDSGWLAAVDPSLDLAAAGMTGTISSGQSVNWRVAVQDQSGDQSTFSDWATYTYYPLPTLTLDSPAAGVMYDPTSDVLAHVGGGGGSTLAAYRVQVTDGDDRSSVRYDSGKRKATDPANIAEALPLRNSDGSRIFTDDDNFQIHVRAWDNRDRQATPGLAAHVDVWATVHFDDNGALAKVSSFQATQVDQTPFVQLTWTDVAAADAYLIARDGVHIARLTSADVVVGVSTYSWTEPDPPAPADNHIYAVRRLTVGVGRSAPRRDSIKIFPQGLWLLRANGDSVRLSYTSSDAGLTLRLAERRATYSPVNLPHSVDILTAYEGLSGHAGLSVCDMDDQSIHEALRVLDAIKTHSTDSVRLIYADVSKPVLVSNMSVVPSPVLYEQSARLHMVDFDVTQVGEFDFRVG